MNTKAMEAAKLAKVFHETYERLAPTFGYATRIESAKPWEQVPPTNKDLMIAVCQEIISKHFPEPSVPVSELKKLERHNFIDDGEIFVMIDGAQFDALIAKVSACDAS